MTTSDVARDFIAGSVGGFAGKLFDYPLDTVKVLLQTQTQTKEGPPAAGVKVSAAPSRIPKPPVSSASASFSSATTAASAAAVPPPPTPSPPVVYNGAWDCLSHTVRTRGVTSLYKGISSPLLGSVAENAVLFWAYSGMKRAMGKENDDELSLLQLSTAGAGAGFAVAFVLTPVELVKCRMQVQNSSSGNFRTFRGPVDVVWHAIRTEGISGGLFRGHTSTMLREIPGNFCYFGVYELVCKSMIPEGGTKKDLGTSAHMLGGMLSGASYWTAFYPADTVKSLMQTHPAYANATFVEAFRNILRTDGVRGLYRGWGITVARAAPAHALVFASYEYTMNLLS